MLCFLPCTALFYHGIARINSAANTSLVTVLTFCLSMHVFMEGSITNCLVLATAKSVAVHCVTPPGQLSPPFPCDSCQCKSLCHIRSAPVKHYIGY